MSVWISIGQPLRPDGVWNNDVVFWHKRVYRNMRPGEALEIQQDRLGVLNLCEMNRNLARHIQVKRDYAGERRYALTRDARFGFDREGLTGIERRHLKDLFDGFDPENGSHLHGVSVRLSCPSIPQQEGDVVGSAPEERRRRRGRGNVEDDGVDDLLFADVTAQQTIWIVQKGLRDGARRDEAA